MDEVTVAMPLALTPELRAQLQTLGLWIAEALTTLDTVEPECSTEAELLTALIRRGEMLVLASLAGSNPAIRDLKPEGE
jgi:hypothetical protein